jgi:hypothetical protein
VSAAKSEKDQADFELGYKDVTDEADRLRPTFDAEMRADVDALDCSVIGYVRATTPGGAEVLTQISATKPADAYAIIAQARNVGLETVGFQTILHNGTAVMTEAKPALRKWLKLALGLRTLSCPGYDVAFEAHGLPAGALYALHRARVTRIAAEEKTRPIVHESLEAYLAVRRASAPRRAARHAFQARLANKLSVGFALLGGLATVGFFLHALRYQSGPSSIVAVALLVATIAGTPVAFQLGLHYVGPLVLLARPRARVVHDLSKLPPYR